MFALEVSHANLFKYVTIPLLLQICLAVHIISNNACQVYVDELVDVIKKLCQFFVNDAPMSARPKSKSNEPSDMNIDTAEVLVDNGDEELESYLYESSGPNGNDMNELDKYMADPPIRLTSQFNILAW